jgi:putative salt-induced outer membrane protein
MALNQISRRLPAIFSMLRRPLVAVALALLAIWPCLAGSAHAQGGSDFIDPEARRGSAWAKLAPIGESQWRGDAELGYLATSGNTETETTHTRWRIQNDRPNWIHAFRVEATIARTAEDTSAVEEYRASQRSAYKLTAVDYLFEKLRYERNVAQGFHYRWSEVVGYGRRVYGSAAATVYLEAGPGARQTWLLDETVQREALLVVSGEWNWNFTPTATLNEFLVAEAGETNTYTNWTSALTVRINSRFSSRISYDVVDNSDVPEGIEHTDTTTTVTIVYAF